MTATSNHLITGLSVLIAHHQRRLSDRLHATGDAVAGQRGWDIAVTTGWLGFGGLIYRDHRFTTRAPGHPAGRALAGQQHESRTR